MEEDVDIYTVVLVPYAPERESAAIDKKNNC